MTADTSPCVHDRDGYCALDRDENANKIGQFNGRYAILFKILLYGAPIFGTVMTVFMIPFVTWIVSEQWADIANRSRTDQIVQIIERQSKRHDQQLDQINHLLRQLPNQDVERRIGVLEECQRSTQREIRMILLNQTKIMQQMGMEGNDRLPQPPHGLGDQE